MNIRNIYYTPLTTFHPTLLSIRNRIAVILHDIPPGMKVDSCQCSQEHLQEPPEVDSPWQGLVEPGRQLTTCLQVRAITKTMEKPNDQKPAFSRKRPNADNAALPTTPTNVQVWPCEAGVIESANTASLPGAMGRVIERHRRSLAAVDRLSRNGAARSWTPRAVFVRLALAVSRVLERAARRRLVRQKAFNGHMAEQKILYLIAANMARKMELRPAEIAEIVTSVEDFRRDISDLLQGSEPMAVPEKSDLNP